MCDERRRQCNLHITMRSRLTNAAFVEHSLKDPCLEVGSEWSLSNIPCRTLLAVSVDPAIAFTTPTACTLTVAPLTR